MDDTAPARASADATHAISEAARQKLRMRMILLSLVVGVALMGAKFLTYKMTHSSAVLSDALESIINVTASAFATLSVWLAAKPPDDKHPYGHGKIEYFSAGFEGGLIMMAAVGIFYAGIQRLIHPRALPNLEEGLLILCATTGINLLLGMGLMMVGRRTDSLTLVADGRHILTDVMTSGGVLIGLLLVFFTGRLWLDGAVACLVGANILFTGGQLVRHAFIRLMDASDPALLDEIARLLAQNRLPEWIDIHQLRAWRAGNLTHIDFHLVVPKDLSMERGHGAAKVAEQLLSDHFMGNASVLVHVDPCDEKQCPVCRNNICQWRQATLSTSVPWTRTYLIRSQAQRDDDPKKPE